MHELLEVGLLIRGGPVTESDLYQSAVAVLPFVRHDLVAESPARAHQDVRLRGRAFRDIQLIFDSDLGCEPFGDGMVRHANHELGQRRGLAEPPAGHLGDGVVLGPRGESPVQEHDASAASYEFVEPRRLSAVEWDVRSREDHARPSFVQCAEVFGDLDVEVMRALE